MTRAEREEQIHIICDLGQAPPRMRADFLHDGVAIDVVLREVAAFSRQVTSLMFCSRKTRTISSIAFSISKEALRRLQCSFSEAFLVSTPR